MDGTDPKYSFYEKVRINTVDRKKKEVNGEIGAVLGRDRDCSDQWYYTVYVYASTSCWCFFESELMPTGQAAKREDFFDGSSIRVEVDPNGRGRLAKRVRDSRGSKKGEAGPNL